MHVSKYRREPASGSRQRQPAFSISKTDRCQTVTPSNAGSFVSAGHIHDLVTEETEATCLLNGSRIVTCRLCQDYREEIILPMLGHCDENGDFLCDRCGVVLELFQKGEKQTVKTELPGEWEEMTFTCINEDYKGGQLFFADQVIPYALCSGFGSGTGYDTSGVRKPFLLDKNDVFWKSCVSGAV